MFSIFKIKFTETSHTSTYKTIYVLEDLNGNRWILLSLQIMAINMFFHFWNFKFHEIRIIIQVYLLSQKYGFMIETFSNELFALSKQRQTIEYFP